MVGKVFRVVFTRYAQRRRRGIFDFEERLNGRRHAQKIQRAIDRQAQKLQKTPSAYPPYLDHDSEYEIRYTKALDYKVLFTVLKEVSDVVILTIRNDAENPSEISEEL